MLGKECMLLILISKLNFRYGMRCVDKNFFLVPTSGCFSSVQAGRGRGLFK